MNAPSRATLSSATERILNQGSRRNPDVLLVRHEGGLVVVKDFAPRGFFVRRWLGPWLARREQRAWRALDGHPSVPRWVGAIDRLAFAVEYRPGRTLFGARRLLPLFAYFDRRALAKWTAKQSKRKRRVREGW